MGLAAIRYGCDMGHRFPTCGIARAGEKLDTLDKAERWE